MSRFPVSPRRLASRPPEKLVRLGTALAGAALAVAAGYLALTGLGGNLVSLSYDLPFLASKAGLPENLCIVELDELDEQRSSDDPRGRKTISRNRQAELLDKLGTAGARAVIYDIHFGDSVPGVDEEFAAAIRRFRTNDADGDPLPEGKERPVFLAAVRDKSEMTGVRSRAILRATPVLMEAAGSRNYGVAAYLDDLHLARRITTGGERRSTASLCWVAAEALGGDLEEGNRGEARWLNYPGPPPLPIPTYKASTLLDPIGFNPSLLEGRIVMVGAQRKLIGEQLGEDLFATPFHRVHSEKRHEYLSGVELQALMLANLLDGNWLTRSSPKFERILVLSGGILFGLLLAFLRPVRSFILAVAGIVALAAAAVCSVRYGETWFPWAVVAFAQIPVALVWGSASHFYVERFFRLRLSEEQRALREAFAKYLSPPMLDQLIREGFQTRLGGEKVQAAMLFTDLENFTAMCERARDPEWVINTLNDYFQRTTMHIFAHDGVVVNFTGDGIFAAWGAPLPDRDGPRHAVRAAWDLFLSAKLLADGEELHTRVGVHVGEVVAGNVGSTRHLDYTLIGDHVNLASRLESLNKQLGTSILLSEAIHQHLDTEFITRRVGAFRVKGRAEAITIHELIGPSLHTSPPPWIDRYHLALEALKAGDLGRARAAFTKVEAARQHGDGPSRFFLKAIENDGILHGGVVDLNVK